jgi:hypothetical protein
MVAKKSLMKSAQEYEPRLEQLRQQLAAWRRHGHPHQRTPEAVWREAVELAQALGTSRVAQALRLNYTGLKRRLMAGVARAAEAPSFIELKCPPLISAGECRICLQDRTGSQMSVVMSAPDTAVLRELAQIFWPRSL